MLTKAMWRGAGLKKTRKEKVSMERRKVSGQRHKRIRRNILL